MTYSPRFILAGVLALGCAPSLLFAQQPGSAPPSSSAKFVYVADAFSSDVAGFAVADDGTLSPVAGSPYPIPMEFPNTVGPLWMAYIAPYLVVSGGNPNTWNSFTVFKVDTTNGVLTNVSQGPPLATYVDYVTMTADTKTGAIYVIGENNAASPVNGIASFKLNSEGSMTQIGPTMYPNSPSYGTLALDPLGRFLYVYNPGLVYVYTRNSDGTLGSQVAGSPFTIGQSMNFQNPDTKNPCFAAGVQPTLVPHPNGKWLYTSCLAGEQVTVSSVASSGAVTHVGSIPLRQNHEVSALALNKSGTRLFGTQELQDNVAVFTVNAINGAPKLKYIAAAGTRPNGVAIDSAATNLYVTNGSSNIFKGDTYPGSNDLSYYSLSPTGQPAQLPNSPIATGQDPRVPVVVEAQGK